MEVKTLLLVILGLACAQASRTGKVEIGGKEYFVSTEELSWTKAADACHAMGMNMLAIESEAENTNIFDYMENNGLTNIYFWTGGKELGDTSTTDGVWTWVDLDTEFSFTNWAGDRPNPFARGFCVYLSGWSRWWLDGDCGGAWRFFCEAY